MLALYMTAFYDWSFGLTSGDTPDKEEIVDEELENKFDKACEMLVSVVDDLSNEDKLFFYGRYKCAIDGKPKSSDRPGIFEFSKKTKFHAWVDAYKSCITKSKAINEYIEKLQSITGVVINEKTIVKNATPPAMDMKPSTMMFEADKLNDDADETERMLFEWRRILREDDIEAVEKILDSEDRNKLIELWDASLGMTSLHLAADSGRTIICGLLCLNGADVNKQDNEGQTAMHIAIECDNKDVAIILARHNPNLEIKNNEGKTVYDLLEEKKLKDLTMTIEKIMFAEMKEEDQIVY
uniref:Acyl-CoA-binding domain-containing protein 6 n=1 Tax=Parastrongyloides trichosuri TaxID=131310 RepID=A0A0N4ZF32_PARTI